MRGRGPALSEWELDELLMHARAGWTARELAHYYGVSERTVVRYLRQARNGDISPAGRRVDQLPTLRPNGTGTMEQKDERGIQMTIEVCGWRIEPYGSNGKRCWQLTRAGRKTPERYYDDLGKALRFVAEWAMRNDEPGTMDVQAALDRYERIAERIEGAVA